MDINNVDKNRKSCITKRLQCNISHSTILKVQSFTKTKINTVAENSNKNEELLDKIISIFDKKIRSLTDIQFIAVYLETLKDFTAFIKTNNVHYQDLLIHISCYLKLSTIPKNRTLFRFGKDHIKLKEKKADHSILYYQG